MNASSHDKSLKSLILERKKSPAFSPISGISEERFTYALPLKFKSDGDVFYFNLILV